MTRDPPDGPAPAPQGARGSDPGAAATPRLRAVLDACVLYPPALRRCLLAAADIGHYAPVWSPRILGEWQHRAARDGGMAEAEARAALEDMARRWPGALADPAPLDADLPDPDDLHVLAACVSAGAGHLVTRNHRDFPARTLARFGVMRSDPDTLLSAFAREDVPGFRTAITAALPGADPGAVLKRAGLPRLARLIRG